LSVYGDFSLCPAAAHRGLEWFNAFFIFTLIKFTAALTWSVQAGVSGNPDARSGPASQLPSPTPMPEVEAVAFAVALDALLEAEGQAAVALAGELGAPGALSCRQREAHGQTGLSVGLTPPLPGSYLLQEGLPSCQS